ncbi:MAG: ABC transporter substrate-binding protein [Syntrophorhabdaceae bacterium]|nr:ABC transporter substrate-binding protein [Syntrophorhabdaceae bacterium]
MSVFNAPHAYSTDQNASFIPQWSPQAQFAGYYVAFEKGIYKKYGINLQIIAGGPYTAPFNMLEDGKADFCTAWLSTAIKKRSQGLKIINIAQIIQRSALMLIAKKQKGITRPEDLNGKRVGLWRDDFRLQPMALFKKFNVNVTIIPQSNSVNLFLRDGVDVASAMWYNEYHTVLSSGINDDELTRFFFHEYGLNFPEDGIYTLEDTFHRNRAFACNFVKASIDGWIYAFKNTEETLDIILKYMKMANVPANRVHQRWMLMRMKDLIITEGDDKNLGILNKDDFYRVARSLKENRLIQKIPDFGVFFKRCVNHVQN